MNDERNFNDVMQRLKNVSNASSYNSLADMMGLSSSAFANFKKRNSIPYDKVFALANSLNVSIDWLLTGEGGIYLNAKNEEFLDRMDKAAFELFLALSPTQRKEISAAIEEKKRMNELVETVNQLQKKVG